MNIYPIIIPRMPKGVKNGESFVMFTKKIKHVISSHQANNPRNVKGALW